ncbi:hypothetical protein ACF1GS_25045, partial [Streptomyces eurythermus]|uniref:hypothetical protein n=1 Tax=Streptomyces eurythermus TaxID=42237 RepID=UPI003703406C
MADQAPAPGPLPEDTGPGSTLRPTYGRVREAQVPQTFFDALAVRTWCSLSLRALGRAREEI